VFPVIALLPAFTVLFAFPTLDVKIPVFPLVLIALTFLLLYFEGKRKPRDFARSLSLDSVKPAKSLRGAALLFAKMILLLILLSIAFNALGANDSTRVVEVLRAQPVEMLFAAVALAPFAEELFFRGYLQKRVGIIVSSALFASLHYSYGSVSEVVSAFFIAILIGMELRKKNDLNSCIGVQLLPGVNRVNRASRFNRLNRFLSPRFQTFPYG
jgi:membrane protease YdiL (CAAX protease family)